MLWRMLSSYHHHCDDLVSWLLKPLPLMYHLQNKSAISHHLQPLFITKALSNPQIVEAGYVLEGYK